MFKKVQICMCGLHIKRRVKGERWQKDHLTNDMGNLKNSKKKKKEKK